MTLKLSRKRTQNIERIVAISFAVVCIIFCGSILAVWAFFTITAQQHLTKIQTALDETCGAGIVVAEMQYYDTEFSGYSSPQARCSVGSGEYTCECRLTPSPTPLMTQTPHN
jgi:hypothetical protein